MTHDEYLKLIENSEICYEYAGGEVTAISL